MFPGDSGQAVELLPPSSDLLGLRLVAGKDTVSLGDWDFVPSSEQRGGLRRDPADHDRHSRRRHGGAALPVPAGDLRGLGGWPGGRARTERRDAGSSAWVRDSATPRWTRWSTCGNLGVVTMSDQTRRTDFSSLKPAVATELSGPFDWVAIKSKYFVARPLRRDTTRAGVTHQPERRSAPRRPTQAEAAGARADVARSCRCRPRATSHYTLYAGPMEYPRLARIGHDFYDVNPYGWPGFRTIIRPVRVAGALAAGVDARRSASPTAWCLIIFGIAGARAALAAEPEGDAGQHADAGDPAAAQGHAGSRTRTTRSGCSRRCSSSTRSTRSTRSAGAGRCSCPMPILFALFFVFQNTIELRGASFLWLPDLSRAGPAVHHPGGDGPLDVRWCRRWARWAWRPTRRRR